jgi:hypothetical protein
MSPKWLRLFSRKDFCAVDVRFRGRQHIHAQITALDRAERPEIRLTST